MQSDILYQRQQAALQFHRARRRAAVESLLAWLGGDSADLLSYYDVVDKLGMDGQSSAGVRQIPLSAIVGSVGRYHDFSRSFLPRQDHDESRWVNIGAVQAIGDLPPIEVYQIGDAYFVRDGNHRVSVARQRGLTHIDADITEVHTRVPLPRDARPDDLIIAAELADFLAGTKLDRTRPGCNLRVTVPGQYAHLENRIEAFRYGRETEANAELTLEQAAALWHDEVYAPFVAAMREQAILRYFPGRTETDFFIWLARHRDELERRLGTRVDPATAVARLLPRAEEAERATRRAGPLRRLRRLVLPDTPPRQPSWSAQRVMARYSDHLFANILLPFAVDETRGMLEPPPLALGRALGLAAIEHAHLELLALLDHEPTQTERAALDRLRDQLRHHAANADLDEGRGDPAQRAIDVAFVNDLIVLNRHFSPADGDAPALSEAARRVIIESHRPLYLVSAANADDTADEVPPRRVLLVHDTRRQLETALFIAAYTAEQWRVALTILPLDAGRHTDEVIRRIDDYLQFHEVSAAFLPAVRPGKGLSNAIIAAAAEHECDAILLPAPVDPGNPRRAGVIDAVLDVAARWPRAVIIAG